MKRARDASQSDSDMYQAPSYAGPSRTGRTSKRAKSIQACTSCRKHKTRCEILEQIAQDTVIQCHRCKVLGVPCSYADMDRSVFLQHFQQQQAESRGSPGGSGGASGDVAYSPPSGPVANERLSSNIPKDNILHEYAKLDQKFPKLDYMWDFVGRSTFDWASPMVAIQELSKQPPDPDEGPPPPLPAVADTSVDDILTPDQKNSLLDL
jgi:hypothetical protein